MGTSGDLPLLEDFDGDGKTDLVVWRDATAMWYILPSGGGASYTKQWGASGYVPLNENRNYRRVSGQILVNGSALAGVMVALSGTTVAGTSVALSATTDSSGKYSFLVPSGGAYTITPSLTGYTFSPVSQTVSGAGGSQTADFTATQSGGGPPGSSTKEYIYLNGKAVAIENHQ